MNHSELSGGSNVSETGAYGDDEEPEAPPRELRERAFQMVAEHEGEYASRWAARSSCQRCLKIPQMILQFNAEWRAAFYTGTRAVVDNGAYGLSPIIAIRRVLTGHTVILPAAA